MVISKKPYFFKSPDRGGGITNFRVSNLFLGDGAKLHFFYRIYRTCCFPGVPDSLPPLDPRSAYLSMFVAF